MGSVVARFTTTTRSRECRRRKPRRSAASCSMTAAGVSTAPHGCGTPRVPPGTMSRSISARSAACASSTRPSKIRPSARSAAASSSDPARSSQPPNTRADAAGSARPSPRAPSVVTPRSGTRPRAAARAPTIVVVATAPRAPMIHTPVRGLLSAFMVPLPEWLNPTCGCDPITGSEHAEGLEELMARGWTRIYRAPQGEGVERRASFAALDLSYGPELRCRCGGVGDAVEESKSDVSLRFRWERGKMLETSATGGARQTGLSPAITAGHLVTYDFATEGAFPGGKAGSCGAHLALTLLIEPPIL